MSEKSPKKKWYRIPCTWESYGVMHIEAESLEEAKAIADDDPLPDAEYVDGSFEINEEMLEFFLYEDGHRKDTIYNVDEEVIE